MQPASLPLKKLLAERIRDACSARAWTQVQTARFFGCAQSRVSMVFNHRVEGFTLDYLVGMANALGLQISMEVNEADELQDQT